MIWHDHAEHELGRGHRHGTSEWHEHRADYIVVYPRDRRRLPIHVYPSTPVNTDCPS